MIKHQPDGIEEILDDCTIALTSRTEDDIKITSFDERLMDIPKLKAALNSYITAKMNEVDRAARIDEIGKWLESDTTLDYGFLKDRLAELRKDSNAAKS